MPPRPVLAMLLALAVAPPLAAQATGSVVGSYTMFNRIERYHLALSRTTAGGEQPVTLRSIARHLSPEARRILLPADGYAVGADQIDLAVAGLGDLARLLCRLDPKASAASARLVRDPFDASRGVWREQTATCRGAP